MNYSNDFDRTMAIQIEPEIMEATAERCEQTRGIHVTLFDIVSGPIIIQSKLYRYASKINDLFTQ